MPFYLHDLRLLSLTPIFFLFLFTATFQLILIFFISAFLISYKCNKDMDVIFLLHLCHSKKKKKKKKLLIPLNNLYDFLEIILGGI
jgi:hypothetical protein